MVFTEITAACRARSSRSLQTTAVESKNPSGDARLTDPHSKSHLSATRSAIFKSSFQLSPVGEFLACASVLVLLPCSTCRSHAHVWRSGIALGSRGAPPAHKKRVVAAQSKAAERR